MVTVQRGGMRDGRPVRRTKGGVAVKTTKRRGCRSESCDISEAALQTAPPKLVVSKEVPGRRVGKMGTYDVEAQGGGGGFLVRLRDAPIYPASE